MAQTLAKDTLLSSPSPNDPTLKLSVPASKATPAQVRDFLIQLLVKHRGLDCGHAEGVASKWTLGTGRELAKYPPTLYAEIFGLEDGWMVYKEANLFIRQDEQRKGGISLLLWGLWIFPVLVAVSMMLIGRIKDDELRISLFATCLMGLFLWIIAVVIYLILWKSLENQVEEELREGLGNMNKKQ